ncbi:MAG: hypothetical protein HeimC3_14250 [Candidatus Heimdallarchaeota archaeon LC_3]|nr:MAG: hypothetical protein HeimC3_14250 [Candidatus Heimdallarchaeota archaeon LC_3]
MELYIPKISIFLLFLLFLRLLLNVLEYFKLTNIPILKFFFSIHLMDYTPIWVFLDKIKEGKDSFPENWRISEIYYDKGHYLIGKSESANKEMNIIRPPFEIRNTWHSLNIPKRNYSIILPGKCLFLLFVLELIVLSSLLLIITYFLWGKAYLIIIQTLMFIFLIFSIYVFNSEIVHPLIDFNIFKDETGKYFLTKKKYEVFWNFKDYHSRFKIIDKVLNPFDTSWENNWD